MKKRKKNLIAAKRGLVGMKGYLKAYNQYLNCRGEKSPNRELASPIKI